MTRKKVILKIESRGRDGVFFSYPQDWLNDYLAPLFEKCEGDKGGYVQCEFSVPQKKRTLPQNAKYWAMCTEYGRHLGMTAEEVSLGVKYRAMDEGLWEGNEIAFTGGRREPMSTTRASTEQMAVLIEVLYRIAAEDGYIFCD